MPQTSTTGSLENASREMITSARYTEEHNAPCMELVEKFTLQKGTYGHLSHLGDYESVRTLLEIEFLYQLHAGCVMFFRIPSRRDHLAAGIFQ